jgi:hypothetical protein
VPVLTDEKINETIKQLSDLFVSDDVRHIIIGIHREKKNMCVRSFGNQSDLVNMMLVVLNYNQKAWDELYQKMSQVELIKTHMIMRDGGNT